ncbi:pilus assembly protein [Agrobacterium tumefaciens]|uniref:TadE/TadG family type IV pilus assembly protein n=1 Tax=Agrobacterium tumefaciens TaxID=358 RepID=UPI0015746009|nr:TadE/TadG family type IV pilus assembly protein [Agrobacterium tumefaciens]UXT20448.1 pilus assembly protein [Agrobacterium tumefaciens]WHO20760.1 pilus assembly protein [Agrobacterium tumefaciens]WHO23545.1 pilus assembly protein [Agrobacterium tumefaciens]
MKSLQLANILTKRATYRRMLRVSRDRKGNAGIEFALVAPIFVLVLLASTDLGMLLFSRFRLEEAVSASASYAIAHADQVDSANGDELAKNLALMIASNHQGDATAFVQINNGSQASYDGTKIKIGGVASQANACYCPKGSASTVEWGSQQTCGAACPDGGRAGRYVSVTAREAYTPLFSALDIVKADSITASTIVQTK